MKTKKTISPALLFISVLLVNQCHGQSNVVYYGAHSNSISVSFVDTNLSVSAKASIVADLQICLSEWGKGELRLWNEGDYVGYIDNPTRCPHYPEDMEFPEKVVSNGVSGLALHIPKKLSDAYTNAFAFAAANSNIVAAAYEFVAFVSSSNFVALSSNALPDYVMQKNMSTNDIVETADEIFSDLQKQTYYPPSILGFYYSQRGPSVSNLWLHVPSSINPPLGMDWLPFPALWHEGKWRFCVWDNWVQ